MKLKKISNVYNVKTLIPYFKLLVLIFLIIIGPYN